MKVLSLFDGMACGMLAMRGAGIQIDRYVAYEIDKYATQTASHNFPMIEQKGDVFQADFTEYSGFDFLIGGSPCTYWSIAQKNNRETEASGMGWELFSQYVRALGEAKPRYFVYENNKSMSNAIRESITQTFGFEPVCINSALVSAQNRQRLYWVGKRNEDGTYSRVNVEQPEDRRIVLRDILESGICYREKATALVGNRGGGSLPHDLIKSKHTYAAEPVNVTADGKAQCLRATYYKDGIRNMVGNTIDRKTCVAVPVNVCGDKSHTLKAQYYKNGIANFVTNGGYDATAVAEPICLNSKSGRGGVEGLQPSLQDRIYSIDGKHTAVTTAFMPKIAQPVPGYATPCEWDENGKPIKAISAADGKIYQVYEVKDGQITIKGKEYPIKLVDGFYIIRKLTVRECMRLQTVPEWYEFPVSDTQAYKLLGNGWTVEVIVHLLKCALATIGEDADDPFVVLEEVEAIRRELEVPVEEIGAESVCEEEPIHEEAPVPTPAIDPEKEKMRETLLNVAKIFGDMAQQIMEVCK